MACRKKSRRKKGLKANGRLKKGYCYNKRGQVVKAASAKKSRPKKKRATRRKRRCGC